MHFFCHRVLFCLLTLFTLTLNGQNILFQSYDCRDEVEIMARIEKEKLLKEIAFQDSIDQVNAVLALLKAEQDKILFIDTLDYWKHWTLVDNYSFGKNRGGIPMITDLNALHPYFRDKVIELIHRCEAKGIELAIVETYRTHAKQSEYKSMGKKYTRSGAGKSKHQYGLAIDVVPIVNGEPEWNNKYLWRRVGVVGEQLGLRWGGRWRSLYDPGHFEWTGGLSAEELARGKAPYVHKAELYPCLDYDLRILAIYWQNWESEQAAYAANQTID